MRRKSARSELSEGAGVSGRPRWLFRSSGWQTFLVKAINFLEAMPTWSRDHSTADQSSIIRFVEDNWLRGQRIGQGSFDAIANSITQMFNFTKIRSNGVLFLNPSTGETN